MARKAVHLKRKRAPFGGFLLCLALLSSTGVAFSSWQIGGTVGPKPEQVVEVGDVFEVGEFVSLEQVSSTPICPEGFVRDETLVYAFSVFATVSFDRAALYAHFGSTDYMASLTITLNYDTDIGYDYRTTMIWRIGSVSQGTLDVEYAEGAKSPSSCWGTYPYQTTATTGLQNIQFEFLFPASGVGDSATFASKGLGNAYFDYSVSLDLALETKAP